MQVDPIKRTLKAPKSMLLKLGIDGPVSNFVFNFNLRHYMEGAKYCFNDGCQVVGLW